MNSGQLHHAQIQIISGPDFLKLMKQTIQETEAVEVIKALGDIYINRQAAMQILGIKSGSALEHRITCGRKDKLGIYHKLPKYFPYGNNTPGFLLHEVFAHRQLG